MNNSSNLLVALGAMAAAVYSTIDILTGNNGPLSIALVWVGVILCIFSISKPQFGLYCLAITCFYGDYYKKLAVIYGVVSMNTVMEVLAVNLGILCCTILGTMKYAAGRPGNGWIFRAFSIVLLIVLIHASTGDTLKTGLIEAANSSLYLGFAVCLAFRYRYAPEEISKYIHWLVVLTIPYVAMAAYQYWFGFFDMDWEYARSALSVVYSMGMFSAEHPRVFGFAGTPFGFGGATCLMSAYCLWHTLSFHHQRGRYMFYTALMLFGVVLSEQRTILFIPLLVIVAAVIFQNQRRTTLAYVVSIMLQVGLIAASPFLLEQLRTADTFSSQHENDWIGRVVRLGSFSDRLQGWSRLTRPSSYSLIGTGVVKEDWGGDDYYHDRINSILMKGGVVGLFGVSLVSFYFMRKAHRFIYNMPNERRRKNAAFMLAYFLVNMVIAVLTGGHLNVNPWNLLLAISLGYLFACGLHDHLARLQAISNSPTDRPVQGTDLSTQAALNA